MLGKDVFDNVSVDIGEAELAALELISQRFMIDTELIKNGGVEVVHVDFILSDIIGKIISGSVGHAGLDATAGSPE